MTGLLETPPELILLNGTVRTQDPALPLASAVAAGNGRILAVGDKASIEKLAGPATRVVDARGRLVVPGMMDAHFHYQDWALGLVGLSLADAPSLQAVLDRVGEARRPPSGWILGQGWNEGDWPENRMPTRQDLDRVAPDVPVALARCDLHLYTVNSRALELAGITSQTPDPPEGIIARDDAGQPNGILREQAIGLVKAVIPSPGEEELMQAMRSGISVLHSLGLTAVHDIKLQNVMDDAAKTFRAWQRLRDRDELDLRCWVSLPGEGIDQAIALGLRSGFGDDRLRIGHLKYFADGGMGARTAWLVDPYEDGGSGLPLIPVDELRQSVHKADRAGLAVMIHAIGDRANREVISILEEVLQARSGREDLASPPRINHRLEHVQMIQPRDLERLKELPVDVCVQPANQVIDITMLDACLGGRTGWAYAYRSMLDAGLRVLFSSDSPVCNPSPLMGIHALVTRQRRDGTPPGGWHPEQRVTVEEAIAGYTIVPARAYGLDEDLGSITPGKRADMVMLDQDITTIDPSAIPDTRVDMTVFDGRVVFERQANPGP